MTSRPSTAACASAAFSSGKTLPIVGRKVPRAAAVSASALAALVIGFFVVRTRGIYFIMVTMAFAQMVFYLFFDNKVLGGSDGVYINFKPAAGLFALGVDSLVVMVAFLLVGTLPIIGSVLASSSRSLLQTGPDVKALRSAATAARDEMGAALS